MALKDRLLYGAYVGLVLETQDPDGLGRVKVLIPGINGPIFKGWNDKTEDISFTTLNKDPFEPDVLERLLGVLPWARPSTPVFGGGTGAPVNSDTLKNSVMPTDQTISQNTNSATDKPVDNRVAANDMVNNKQGEPGNATPIGNQNGGCNANSSGNKMSLQESRKISSALNQQIDANGLSIVTKNGVMDKDSFKAYANERLKCSPLLNAKIDPQEAASYGITNTADTNQWADFMWRTALAEQGGKVAASGYDTIHDPGGSWGAWSTSVADTRVYAGYSGKGIQDLQSNPELAANTAISMAESQVTRNNTVGGLDHSITTQGSFAHTTMLALQGKRGTLSAAKSGALVQRTTSQGVNAIGSSNMSRYGSPIGNFSIPAAGSKVWVVFENGSPQRPVYIGQVYEPSNIQSVS